MTFDLRSSSLLKISSAIFVCEVQADTHTYWVTDGTKNPIPCSTTIGMDTNEFSQVE